MHNNFAEKVINFTYKNKGNFERDFVFESNGKYAYGFAVNQETNQIMYFYNYPD